MTVESRFARSVDESDQFNQLVNTYEQDLASDPDGTVLNDGVASQLLAVALNGADPNFSLIEHTSLMTQFGTALSQAIDTVAGSVGSIGSSTVQVTTFFGSINGTIVDQNGNPIGSGELNSNSSITKLVITLNIEACPQEVLNALVALFGQDGDAVVSNESNVTVTLTGTALQDFLAGKDAAGVSVNYAGNLDTSPITNALSKYGF